MPQGIFYLRMEDSLRPGYTSVCFILSSRTNMSVSARFCPASQDSPPNAEQSLRKLLAYNQITAGRNGAREFPLCHTMKRRGTFAKKDDYRQNRPHPKRAGADNLRRRSRFYQSLIDAPILKSGKKTRYRHLPSTVIIFITQEDLFGKDLAMYTFREWCQEVPKLPLDDGTCKIFLNMTSKRGRAELVSLLQYMKNSNLDNAEISVKDQRILDLDKVVREVKESEEWEDVKMNILEIGLERGKELGILQGIEQGRLKTLVQNVESAMKNFNVTLPQACAGLEISVAEYKKAKEQISSWE